MYVITVTAAAILIEWSIILSTLHMLCNFPSTFNRYMLFSTFTFGQTCATSE